MHVRQKVELEVHTNIHDRALKREVAALLVHIFGVGVVGRDIAISGTKAECEAFVDVEAPASTSGNAGSFEPPIGIEVAEVIGTTDPSTQFPPAHLAKRILGKSHAAKQQQAYYSVHVNVKKISRKET